jgi:hypothetical protein
VRQGQQQATDLRRAGERSGLARTTVAVAVIGSSALLFLVVWLYGIALRDARYLDGWILATGMGLQLYFHIALKTGRLSPTSAARWRKTHIGVGYVLVAAFVSHLDLSLPDTSYEYALATGFTLVALSGMAGTYIAASLRSRQAFEPTLTFERIPLRRAEIARAAEAAAAPSEPATADLLPPPPYDAWIADLYATRLRPFLNRPRNLAAHLVGTGRHLETLTSEIDELSGYLDHAGRERLAIIRRLVIEKSRLDAAYVHLGLAEAWLLVHVPLTYVLTVLSVVHIVVVYAFTSRPW